MACWWPCCCDPDYIYAFGGAINTSPFYTATCERFDTCSVSFAYIGSLSSNRPFCGFASTYDGSVYSVCGGQFGLQAVDRIDKASSAWSAETDYGALRKEIAASFDADLHGFGGEFGASVTNEHRTYSGGTWSVGTSVPTAFTGGRAESFQAGESYYFGGQLTVSYTSSSNQTIEHTASGDTFSTKTNLTARRTWPAVGRDASDGIIVTGGSDWDTGTQYTSTNYLYSVAGDSYTTKTAYTASVSNMSGAGFADGVTYVLGGSDVGGARSQLSEYDFSGNSWSAVANMGTARGYLGAGAA